jgi:hypothetical protein
MYVKLPRFLQFVRLLVLVLGFIPLAPGLLSAEPIQVLTGTITDRATDAPIVGAKVILYGGGIAEVQTDGNGAYSVTGQQYPYTGPATMFVIAHGYFSIFNGVDIANPFPMVVDRTLLPGGPVIAGRIVDATTN